MELLPRQAVEWDRLQERRHITVAWNRREGATTFGLYALAAAAAWEPGHYAWIGRHTALARHAFHELRGLLPEFEANVTQRRLMLECATLKLENRSVITVHRTMPPSELLRALHGQRVVGMVSDGAPLVRPEDYASDWSIRLT